MERPSASYTGLFGSPDASHASGDARLDGADAELIAKAVRENPRFVLDPLSATPLPPAVDGVDAFAVRSGAGSACLVTRLTTAPGAPVGGGYGVACPTEGSGAIDFVSPGGSFGIVPDGVETVNYTLLSGRTRVSTIDGNLWRAPQEATGIDFAESGTGRSLQLMPASSLAKGERYYGGGLVTGGQVSESTP